MLGAYEELGKPIAIELRFDRNLKRIGLKPTSPECRNAFPIRPKKNSHYRWLAAGAFLTHFGIATQCTVRFEDVTRNSEGVMVLDITKTTNVSRGSIAPTKVPNRVLVFSSHKMLSLQNMLNKTGVTPFFSRNNLGLTLVM